MKNLNLFNINRILLNHFKNNRFDSEKCDLLLKEGHIFQLEALKSIGAFIPTSISEWKEFSKQSTFLKQIKIQEEIILVNQLCSRILPASKHNVYFMNLNPNYSFPIKALDGILAYSLNNDTYIFLHYKPGYDIINFIKKVSCVYIHEYHHIFRNQNNKSNKKKKLFDFIIEEGLAESFVMLLFGEESLNPWAKKVNFKGVIKHKGKILDNMFIDEPEKIYSILNGDVFKKIPHWLGYSFGFYYIQFLISHNYGSFENLSNKSLTYFTDEKKLSFFIDYLERADC